MRYIVIAFVVLALDIFVMVDIALTPRERIKSLRKWIWFLIAILPGVGAVLWFLLGKTRGEPKAEPRFSSPDDDPDFLRDIQTSQEREERIRKLEEELSKLDDDEPEK